MKKWWGFIIIVFAFLCLSGCAGGYEEWQEIEIFEAGTFKMPPEWVYHRIGNQIYLTKHTGKMPTKDNTYIIGIVENGNNSPAPYTLFDADATYLSSVMGETFSNNATIGKGSYVIDGAVCERFYLEFYISLHEDVELLVWDDSIDYEMVRKIAKSYKPNPQ